MTSKFRLWSPRRRYRSCRAATCRETCPSFASGGGNKRKTTVPRKRQALIFSSPHEGNFMVRRKPNGPQRRSASRDGAAVVELVIVMPFLALLVLGVAEMGQGLKAEAVLAEASRNGAATAGRPGSGNSDV